VALTTTSSDGVQWDTLRATTLPMNSHKIEFYSDGNNLIIANNHSSKSRRQLTLTLQNGLDTLVYRIENNYTQKQFLQSSYPSILTLDNNIFVSYSDLSESESGIRSGKIVVCSINTSQMFSVIADFDTTFHFPPGIIKHVAAKGDSIYIAYESNDIYLQSGGSSKLIYNGLNDPQYSSILKLDCFESKCISVFKNKIIIILENGLGGILLPPEQIHSIIKLDSMELIFIGTSGRIFVGNVLNDTIVFFNTNTIIPSGNELNFLINDRLLVYEAGNKRGYLGVINIYSGSEQKLFQMGAEMPRLLSANDSIVFIALANSLIAIQLPSLQSKPLAKLDFHSANSISPLITNNKYMTFSTATQLIKIDRNTPSITYINDLLGYSEFMQLFLFKNTWYGIVRDGRAMKFFDKEVLLEIDNSETSYEESTIIFPNPVKDFLFIKSNSKYNIAILYDMNGKLVKIMDYDSVLDFSGYQCGMYYLTLSSNFISKTFKIIKI
jgi:hypothetical protein